MSEDTQKAQLKVEITASGFADPVIAQWRRDGHSIAGASDPAYDFDPTTPGGLSFTATFPIHDAGGATAAAWDGSPVALVIIGDSTSVDQGFGDPTAGIPAELLAYSGRVLTIVANCAANGTTTRDWADTSEGSLLSRALVKAKDGKATHIMVTLGPNDCSVNHQITADEFKSNLAKLSAAANANGQKVILNYGLLPLLSAGENSWPQSSIDLGLSYRPIIDALIDRKNILLGDTRLADYLRDNPSSYIGGSLQEWPLVGGYHQWKTGVQHSARLWAEGIEFAVYPPARDLRSTWNNPPLVNPDKSINWENRAKHWTLWDTDSISKRIGGHFKANHPGKPVVVKEEYYHYPEKTDTFIRTLFGAGETVTTDKDLGHPGQAFETWKGAQEVDPYNLSVNGLGIDPGVGNLQPLPNNAIDILDPDNNPGGYVTTTGVITRDQYLADRSKYSLISGRGDGFTPAEIFLQQHRQDWIEQKPGLYSNRWWGNYWSVRGQTLFVPKGERSDSNLPVRSVQFGAYYNLAIRTIPKAGGLFWGPSIPYASCIYVSDKIVCGEALATDPVKRILTVVTSPTSRDGDAPPPPVYQFPEGEIPMKVSSSDMNELAAVIVWTSKGSKIVLFALQGYALKNHSQPWFGFSNLGSFSGFRWIGERELPFACADGIKIGTDAALAPQPDPGSINLADSGQRYGYSNINDPQRYLCFPKACWFAVTSREEGEFRMYDFSLWMNHVWSNYLERDQVKWEATRAAHDGGTFPPNLKDRPDLAPTEILAFPVARPTCMIASGYGGPEIGWDYSDIQKLVIGCEDGTAKFVNISWYADPYNWTGYNPPSRPDWARPSLWGSIWIGRGLVHMAWARYTIPNSEIHYLDVMNAVTTRREDKDAHGFANAFYAVCRGDNEVKLVINHWDETNHRQISGTHLKIQVDDPTCVAMQDRFNIVNIGSGDGAKVKSFQKGWLGRSPEPDHKGNQSAYPGFAFPPDPRDPKKLIGNAGEFAQYGFVVMIVSNNAN